MTGPGPLTWQPLLPAAAVIATAVAVAVVLAMLWWRDRSGAGNEPVDLRGWVVRGLVALLLAVAALGPGHAGAAPAFEERRELQILFVVDRTVSMSATDVTGSGSRLDQLRADLTEMGERWEQHRMGVLTWGTSARLVLPFTTDDRAFAASVRSLRREQPTEGVGSRVDRPLSAMLRVLERARAQHPERHTVVVFASDGENTVAGAQRPFTPLRELVGSGAVIGYGTDRGGTMPLTEGGTGLVPGPTGEPAVSRRDQDNLRLVADQLDIAYLPRERLDLEQLETALTPPPRLVRVTATGSRQLVWVIGLPLLGLLLIELRRSWLGLHEARRLRRSR